MEPAPPPPPLPQAELASQQLAERDARTRQPFSFSIADYIDPQPWQTAYRHATRDPFPIGVKDLASELVLEQAWFAMIPFGFGGPFNMAQFYYGIQILVNNQLVLPSPHVAVGWLGSIMNDPLRGYVHPTWEPHQYLNTPILLRSKDTITLYAYNATTYLAPPNGVRVVIWVFLYGYFRPITTKPS